MNPGSEDCLPCACFRKEFSLEVRMEWGRGGDRGGVWRWFRRGELEPHECSGVGNFLGKERTLSERRDEAWKAVDTADCRSEAGTGEKIEVGSTSWGFDINVLVSWWSA